MQEAATHQEPKTLEGPRSSTNSARKKAAWEIDLGGTGRQFVLPPSIHPITRQPYVWVNGGDWSLGLVEFTDEEIRSWLPKDSDARPTGEGLSDLAAQFHWEGPRHFSLAEVDEILDTLADHPSTFERFIVSREGWLEVGMCLHHQYQGSDVGYEKWCSFSAASDKFDEEDSWRVWKSFGKKKAGLPKTIASLKREADDVLIATATGSVIPPVVEELESDFIRPERVEVDDPDDDNPFEFDLNWQRELRLTENEMENDHLRSGPANTIERQAPWSSRRTSTTRPSSPRTTSG